MKICVATDVNLQVCNNKYYLPTQVSTIVKRYYNAFGPIVYCGRKRVVDNIGNDSENVTDMISSAVTVPSLAAVFAPSNKKKMIKEISECDLVVVRCPGLISYVAADLASKLKIPYFTEAMGCAWDAYWNHGVIGKALAPYMFFKMKKVIWNANYALYVTSKFLQRRYPCKNESVAASNVLIKETDQQMLEKRLNSIEANIDKPLVLMTSAAVDVRYKGQEYVIKAIPELNKKGVRVKYVLVGGGDPSFLQEITKKCGVEDQVEFKGRVTLDEVFELLDKANIYIQPSLQEGLPRSMIEAMSRGCACIGAKTAGIPELIDDEFVVRRKNVSDIVDRVYKYSMLSSTQKVEISKRNFEEAKKYEVNRLNARREDYFRRTKEQIIEQGLDMK